MPPSTEPPPSLLRVVPLFPRDSVRTGGGTHGKDKGNIGLSTQMSTKTRAIIIVVVTVVLVLFCVALFLYWRRRRRRRDKTAGTVKSSKGNKWPILVPKYRNQAGKGGNP